MTLQRAGLAVETVQPGDPDYTDAARVFLAAGRPALVVRPRDPDEVSAALAHAARLGMAVSVRSGGHSMLGHGTNDGGMVIDLARLDAVAVLDPARRLVRLGAGATWGRVSEALEPHGWALTAGDTTDVGVGGLTLGGGIGWLVRRHGLAIDNLVAARVVTADGRLLTASADEHPDLFWALRGGGGNFGVVVDLDFLAQPVSTVHFGTITYRLDDPVDLIRRWRDAMRALPDEVSSTLAIMPRRAGAEPTATVMFCYVGVPDALERDVDLVIDPLVSLGTVTAAVIRECGYSQILEDAALPPGMRMIARNTLVRDLDAEVIAAIERLYAATGTRMIALRSLGGAFGRVAADATAFAHRDAEAMVVSVLLAPETASEDEIAQGLAPWRLVADRGIGTYVGFQGSATPADVAAAYPPATYARLASIKRRYDPGNRFAHNHNIAPE